jgi:hypothetical protein
MAAWLDILARLEEGLQQDDRLHLESIYRPAQLPGWIYAPWATAQRNAQARMPILLINCKGTAPGDTVCMVRLDDLERLLGVVRHAK